MDFLNPERVQGKQYQLVSRYDHKLCPKGVQRCEQCRTAFNHTDKVIVKSMGVRERTDKSGKVVKYSGNVYFHFLTQCLKEYDQNFSFSSITVPAHTLAFLPEGTQAKLEAKGLIVEQWLFIYGPVSSRELLEDLSNCTIYTLFKFGNVLYCSRF